MGQRKTTPAKREHILQVAAHLIREHGIEHTTLANIAVMAGISKGTLYYYYSTKSDLIFDIADRHMNNMTDRIFRWLESSGSGQSPRMVFRMVLDTVMHSRSRGHIHLYLIQEALTENPSLRERFVVEYSRWRGIIAEGLNRVYGDNRDYDVMAQVLLTTLDGLMLQRLIGGAGTITIDELATFFESAGGMRRDVADD